MTPVPTDPERTWALNAAWGAIRTAGAADTVRAMREHLDYLATSDPEMVAAVNGGLADPEWEAATRPELEPPPDIDDDTSAAWDAEHPPEIAPNLPHEFWASRPVLTHIRQAAWSRRRSPDAVLGAVLARLAAATPPAIAIPGDVGARASVSYYTLLCGAPGTGKSTSVEIAGELFPIDAADVSDGMPLGSGEGLIELYMGMTEVTTPDGPDKVKAQVRRGAFVVLDEGTALVEMGGRRGATLLPTIRTMWAGGGAGQANASVETRRKLAAGAYTLGLVVGIQPIKASELLADDAAGTPQRFTWVSTTDPAMPDQRPAWPGGIAWTHPEPRPDGDRWTLTLDEEIVAELDTKALAVNRGQITLDPLDAHRDLLRVKTAALLAILEQRLDVTTEDWALAGTVADTSGAVRAAAMAEVADELAARLHTQTRRLVEQDGALEIARRRREADQYADTLESAARSIALRAEKTAPEPLTIKAINAAIGGRRHKALGGRPGVLDAIAYAADLRWITPDGDKWALGTSRPSTPQEG